MNIYDMIMTSYDVNDMSNGYDTDARYFSTVCQGTKSVQLDYYRDDDLDTDYSASSCLLSLLS